MDGRVGMSEGGTRAGIEQWTAVFCGARFGASASYEQSVAALGRGFAERRIGLIYGGGQVGLMGRLADAVLDAGGEVAGIIPEFLSSREVAHPRVTDLTVTDNMHNRKRLMFARADSFVTMPGGLGTLDETIEILTWRQLGLHAKPILIVDVDGWASALAGALEATVVQGFAGENTLELFEVVPDVETALQRLERNRSLTRAPAPTTRL